MDWDDLRYFLALAQGGSLSAAGAALGVSHTTVSRRLAAFADSLGTALFERRPEGFVLTTAGEELLPIAERIEAEAFAAQRLLTGRDTRLRGRLTVTTIDAMVDMMVPSFASFLARYPDVELSVLADNRPVDMTRREADVAIRAANSPPEHLVGRRIGLLRFGPYAAPSLIAAVTAEHGANASLAEYPWVLWDESAKAIGTEAWYAREVGGRPAARVNTATAMRALVAGGVGASVLAVRFAEAWGLAPLGPPIEGFDMTLWALIGSVGYEHYSMTYDEFRDYYSRRESAVGLLVPKAHVENYSQCGEGQDVLVVSYKVETYCGEDVKAAWMGFGPCGSGTNPCPYSCYAVPPAFKILLIAIQSIQSRVARRQIARIACV